MSVNAAIGVARAGVPEQLERLVVQFKQVPTHPLGQLGPAEAMAEVHGLALATGIVKDREQGHHLAVGAGLLGEPQADVEDASPMRQAVEAVPGQAVLLEHLLEERLDVHGRVGWHRPAVLARSAWLYG